jgi:hypothetical protein
VSDWSAWNLKLNFRDVTASEDDFFENRAQAFNRWILFRMTLQVQVEAVISALMILKANERLGARRVSPSDALLTIAVVR